MKKTILTILSILILGLNYSKPNASINLSEYKACFFHDSEYDFIPNENQCSLNINNPPLGDPLSKGEPWASQEKTVVVHSPECYDEQPGML